MAIIEVENLGKRYEIGEHERYLALRDTLTNILKSPLSWLKTKVVAGAREEFWALKDVNFKVEQGEVLGIIGRNGAGKSTLLKILSQITPPTEGKVTLRGRVGSLLEVGTGFHPELTGRENIFLNGAILGMRKREIEKKFDQIVEFAEIGQFLDTPVKRYSSGMYVRLAFSVAAHLEPDILVVDEVLAVGDSEFQKKCLGKMEEVTKKDGRTVLLVSHNMTAVQSLCQRCVLLEKGKVAKIGNAEEVIREYLTKDKTQGAIHEFKINPNKSANITKISILDKDLKPTASVPVSEKFYVDIDYEFFRTEDQALLSLYFYLNGELLLLSSETDGSGKLVNYIKGRYRTRIEVPAFLFNVGYYYFDASLHRPYVEYLDNKQGINFEITDIENPRSKLLKGQNPGKLAAILDYKTSVV